MRDLRHRVAFHRRGLHGLGFAVHMHQAYATCAVPGDHIARIRMERRCVRSSATPAHGPYVVDDVCACVQGPLHDLWLVGIYGDGHTQGQCVLQHRLHTRPLIRRADRLRAGASGFPTDVQDVRALLEQTFAMVTGGIDREMLTSIRKRIGRHIDDAHHAWTGEVNREAGGVPVHGGQKNGAVKPRVVLSLSCLRPQWVPQVARRWALRAQSRRCHRRWWVGAVPSLCLRAAHARP